MLNLNLPPLIEFDVGHADLYIGKAYKIPYFYETSQKRMMREPGGNDTISYKSWSGNFYQFYLDSFHNLPALYITSTLEDCYPMSTRTIGLEKSVERYKQASEKQHFVKDSFTGYYTFGKKLIKQHDTLVEHLKEDEISFSDEFLENIFLELKRRVKDERCTDT